ncbi:MAG: hypothetical protein COB83_03285 [Gammaproteobacteria bacterium]|nr:MAG: hypothetical protein COB83_03285 [Gammaproteobacteria bacterium]
MTENKALALAPLITPFAFTFYAYISDVPGFNMDSGILDFIGLFIGLSLAAIPVAYIYMFFIGGKFYGMLKRRKRVNIFTLTLGSIFVADIPMLLIWPITQGDEFYLTLQLFSFVGLTVGLNCWLLLNLDKFRSQFGKKN